MQCGKCGGNTWYEVIDGEPWAKCVCGNLTPLVVKEGGKYTILRRESPSEYTLPRKGTKLSRCLGALAGIGIAETWQLAENLLQDNSETASQLSVLMVKGFINRVENKKGLPGGSSWELTPEAKTLLNIKKIRITIKFH